MIEANAMHSISPLPADIGGLHIPDAGPVFIVALAVHVVAGLVAVAAGIAATTARKAPGRHPRAGTVYFHAATTIFVTATVMAALRWRHDWHLFVIATVTLGLATLGRWTRRRWAGRSPRWAVWHGCAMAGSYAALFTGFYVDNGPQLPLWNRLPHLTYWILPGAVGALLTWRALVRNHLIDHRATAVRLRE